MEEEFNLLDIYTVLKKRIRIIINFVLLGIILAATYTFFIATPKYSSSTELLVNRTQESDIIQRTDIETNVQLINTYSDIIRNPVILNPVIESLSLDDTTEDLREKISVSTENNSQVFSVEVTENNPYLAAEIANNIAVTFQNELDSIMNVDNITIISDASANIEPISPNSILNLLIGLIVGLLLGISMSIIFEVLDTSVKEEKFIVEKLGWNNLGHISIMNSEELETTSNVKVVSRARDSRSHRSRV